MEYVEGDDMEEMDDIEDMEDFGSLSDGKDDLLKLPMWFPVYLEYFILNFFFGLLLCQLPGISSSHINDYIYIVIPFP
jgi:hypothetical protein